ncbi:MAG: pitrilysin family protein [Candidatus Sericytochromatia bacterium]|nr:pitrilysin family protein [Candidatus Sericytochromatia bacterium]
MRFTTLKHPLVGLHVLSTQKFKTNTVVLNIRCPLEAGRVTRTALLPYILTRGTAAYPSVRDIQAKLDRMYGSCLNADVYKLGEEQIVQFRMDLPNGKFIPGQPELLKEGLAFFHQVLTEPVRESGCLLPAFVDLEKEALRKRVEGLFNNKMQYARIRCVEEMCASEPYRFFSGGRTEDLPEITPEKLDEEYQQLLAHGVMDLFVVGDVNPQAVEEELAHTFNLKGLRKPPVMRPRVIPQQPVPRKEARHVSETHDVNQGQLVMGLRTPVLIDSPDYYAMKMYNGVLGAFSHSKLFTNLRERDSLAYATSSRYDAHKGLLFIQAGIDAAHEARAIEVIHEQLAAMQAGDISEENLQQTRAMLLNTYREANDSPGALVNLAFEATVVGQERPVEALAQALPDIGCAEIAAVAAKLAPDTTYFLRPRASEAVPAPCAP